MLLRMPQVTCERTSAKSARIQFPLLRDGPVWNVATRTHQKRGIHVLLLHNTIEFDLGGIGVASSIVDSYLRRSPLSKRSTNCNLGFLSVFVWVIPTWLVDATF
ncbi:MAG: hypothetical protein J3Q66DRAFT_368541 [Benniella sp.]|nr:MAG: hypothetical protein J3Q66DRAFT_368541 [Benniella sp.]